MLEGLSVETVPKRITPFDATEAAQRYANLLSRIEEVTLVLLEEAPWEGLRLWAVIDAPPFEDSYRDAVYEAQGEVIDSLEEPIFDFRTVNVQELTSPLDSVLPAHPRVLYEQPARG